MDSCNSYHKYFKKQLVMYFKKVQKVVFFRRRFISTKQIYQKKLYIQYQTHYIQKKINKGKKETRNIKRRKKKGGVAIMSFIQLIDIIRSS